MLVGAGGDGRDGLPPAAQSRRSGRELRVLRRWRSNARSARQLGRRGDWCSPPAWRCSSSRRRRLQRRLGAHPGGDREGDQAREAITRSAAERGVRASSCATCARASARPRSSAASTWRSAGRAHAIIGPNGAGKSTLFNLISGRFAAEQRRHPCCNGAAHHRPAAVPDQPRWAWHAASRSPTSIPRLSVFENIRCAVLWPLGYRYSFWQFLADLTRRQRARRGRAGADRARAPARRAGR